MNRMNMKRKFDETEYNGQGEFQYTSDQRYLDPYADKIYIAGKHEIHFTAHVDGDTITRMKKLISEIINDNRHMLVRYDESGKPERDDKDFDITYIVNSPGGSVTSILDFVDYIEFLRSTYANLKFTSIITGLVASAGTIMCVVADRRKMTRFAHAMIHELSGGGGRTNYTRILTHAEFVQKLHRSLNIIYQEARGLDPEDQTEMKKLEDLLIRETWLTSTEYLNLGFVHNIISEKKKKLSHNT